MNVFQVGFFFRVAEGEGHTVGACAACTAYAVNISFRHIRQLEINDVREAVNINTTRGNIRSYQHACATGFEIAQRILPGVLRFVAVYSFGFYARAVQVFFNPVGAVLGAGKYQC